MKKTLSLVLLILCLSLCSCKIGPNPNGNFFSDNNVSGDDLFDEPSSEVNDDINKNPDNIIVETNYQINCISGTTNAYKVEGKTICFTTITEDSKYSISGSFDGNIIIDCVNDFKFELELAGFTLTSSLSNPIIGLSGNEIQITAKKDTSNHIYDYREIIDTTDESLNSACIYSLVDLDLGGKGSLEVYSKNNNGIHSKDDLEVKNLSLSVVCMDNALKGNDSVNIESGNLKLVAKIGDGIKTTNSHINDNNKQKGSITISGGIIDIYAACDGIDSSYDVLISGDDTQINIYTDKYSGYSEEMTVVTSNCYYIRYSNSTYNYSVKYINSASGEFVWENATYFTTTNRNYFYKVNKPTGYDKLELYMYTPYQTQGQNTEYSKMYSMSVNDSYDTLYISTKSGCSWTNYTTASQPQGGGGGGFGGFDEGNKDKGDHSTKGIKADNEIFINAGNIKINSYDDSIHANNTATLENGEAALGNVTINSGNLTLYSNDDGIHADSNLSINGGSVYITNSYEGVEGYNITISGGEIGVISKDDGFNATNKSGSAVNFNGGSVYIYALGDGIDSNSRQSYGAITFDGSNVVVISNSNMNSAIDSDGGYSYKSGKVVAIMPSGGMSNETTHCSNFSSIGKKITTSLTANNYLNVKVNLKIINVTKLPTSINNAMVVYLGSSSVSVSNTTTTSYELNQFGVYWN